MNLLELLCAPEAPAAADGRVYGVVVGLVTNNQDPDGLGRIRVQFPWLSDGNERYESEWARITTPMAGSERGIFFLPEVEDEVLVVFEHGDVRRPIVLGALWNGVDAPPETNSDGNNNIRLIRSRSGHTITLDDTDGSERIEVSDAGGDNSILIDVAGDTIRLSAGKDIEIKAPGGKVLLEAQEVEISATSSAVISASSGLEVETDATLTLAGATVNIN